jgi:hypothetical protein
MLLGDGSVIFNSSINDNKQCYYRYAYAYDHGHGCHSMTSWDEHTLVSMSFSHSFRPILNYTQEDYVCVMCI